MLLLCEQHSTMLLSSRLLDRTAQRDGSPGLESSIHVLEFSLGRKDNSKLLGFM